MTIIQPNKKREFLGRLLFALIFGLVGASLVLVALYSRSVNISHSVTQMERDIKLLHTKNAELKDGLMGLFDGQKLEQIAARKELVKERNPEYLEVNQTWLLVSDF